ASSTSHCQFCRKELTFLGHRVTKEDFATPVNSKQVRQFLGITSYYRRFIHEYAPHAEPLFALTRADVPFGWTQDCQNAMVFLKNKLTSAPILRFPQFSLPFFIHVDACDVGLGAALMQRDEQGRDCAVVYAIRTLHKSKRPYSTPEKECLAVIWVFFTMARSRRSESCFCLHTFQIFAFTSFSF
uniref:Reverse transcriptase/retrotransposon-derived protein RNase H-like domain-containing protein n=1 Tax=Sinocyclocheilus grahami TaxID=75366 RepID=A0A672QI05_SINGR